MVAQVNHQDYHCPYQRTQVPVVGLQLPQTTQVSHFCNQPTITQLVQSQHIPLQRCYLDFLHIIPLVRNSQENTVTFLSTDTSYNLTTDNILKFWEDNFLKLIFQVLLLNIVVLTILHTFSILQHIIQIMPTQHQEAAVYLVNDR